MSLCNTCDCNFNNSLFVLDSMKESYSILSETFLSDPVEFRDDIFDCWLRGYSFDEATKKLMEQEVYKDIIIDKNEDLDKLIYEDVVDSVITILDLLMDYL